MRHVTINIYFDVPDNVGEDEIVALAQAAFVQAEDPEDFPTSSANVEIDIDPPFPGSTSSYQRQIRGWFTDAQDAIMADLEGGAFDGLKVTCFADLHQRVDANRYVEKPFAAGRSVEHGLALANKVAEMLDAWVRANPGPFTV